MSQKSNSKKSNEFIDFGELFWYYAQYWKWILGSVLICIVLMFIHMKFTPFIFHTTANILIKMDDSKGGSSAMGAMAMKSLGIGGLSASENIDDEVRVLASHTLTRKMVNELKLYKIYKEKKIPYNIDLYNESPIVVDIPYETLDTMKRVLFLDINYKDGVAKVKPKYGKLKLGEFVVDKFPSQIKTSVADISFSLDKTKLKKSGRVGLKVALYPLDLAAESYMANLGIGAASKKSNIISLGIDDENIFRSKDVLNKVVELYNIDALADKNKAAKNTAEFIEERISLMSKDLGVIEKNLEDYKKQNKIVDIVAESEMSLEMMKTVQEKAVEIEIELALVRMLEDFLSDSNNEYSLVPQTSNMPEAMATSISDYNNILLERLKLLKSANDSNPTVALLDERIGLLRENVKTSIRSVKNGLLFSKKDWEKKERSLQAKMGEVPRQEREYIEIRRQQEIKAEIYIFLLEKLQEAELTLASNTPKAKVIDAAYTESEPVGPRKKMMLLLSAIIGLFIPVIVIWIKDILRVNLSTISEMERASSLPILGEISRDREGDKIVVRDGVSSSTAELFRLVRTNLQFVLTKKEEKVILVTSSISGEGKSFFTTNLGMSLSLIQGKKVVLVGLDIRNPKLAEYLSIPTKKGITTYLSSDEYLPEDVIVEMPQLHTNLSVVPAGPIPPNPSELLLSDRLETFFDYLRGNFDYIIVDTAPVGMVSDTFSLARISDATIYLYRADYTNKSYLKLARDLAEDRKLKKVSLVMNGTTTKTGYGYGYGEKK